MVLSVTIILLFLFMFQRRINSEPDAPNLRVEIGNVQRGVNISVFDVAENLLINTYYYLNLIFLGKA